MGRVRSPGARSGPPKSSRLPIIETRNSAGCSRLLARVGAERLGAWVINEPAAIAHWLASPVALITTDRPDLFSLPRRG